MHDTLNSRKKPGGNKTKQRRMQIHHTHTHAHIQVYVHTCLHMCEETPIHFKPVRTGFITLRIVGTTGLKKDMIHVT